MAPIPPTDIDATAVATPTLHHRLSRRDAEQSRIAGMLVGCLVAAVLAGGIIYFCFNRHFSPAATSDHAKEEKEKNGHKLHMHHHVHPRRHGHGHTHAHAHSVHAHPVEDAASHRHDDHHGDHVPVPDGHHHRWTHHHHHRHSHHRHDHQKHTKTTKAKTKKKKKSVKPKKHKRKTAPRRRRRRSDRDGSRGTTVRFMPMPPMEMPRVDGAAGMPGLGAAGMGMGMGMGVGDDEFIDYGPGPTDQDPGLELYWGLHPGFPLAQFAEEDDRDGDREVSCNDCCSSFFDALCGVEPASRDRRRREAVVAGDGPIPLGDNEMAGH